MPSDIKNVKLGVCQVFFGGIDLGYTRGGVEVTVSSETKRVEIDQFGKTAINELIMGRKVMVKVPLAETTLYNLAATMPGASIVSTGGVAATGTITVTTNPTNGQTIIVNGKTVTFKTAGTEKADAYSLEVALGATAAATAANLAAALNKSNVPEVALATYTVAAAVVTVTSKFKDTTGNSFTLLTGTAAGAVTMSGGTLTLGANGTKTRADATSGTSINLLTTAKELRLHPQANVATDYSEDFILPVANTAGGLNFAYKLEDERIFNVEFNGYPDTANGNRLFSIGDPTAT